MSDDDALAASREHAGADDPASLRRRLEQVRAGRDDPRSWFERASLHDALGEADAAIPLYRAALDGGLDGAPRTRATIQLARSLRATGRHSAALALLRTVPGDDPLHDAAEAFLALALLDDAKPGPALRTALRTLAPHLPHYRDAIARAAADATAPPRVRVVVVALLVRAGWVLAEEYPATATQGAFLRAPGGGLEFGESLEAGIRREIDEELAAEMDRVRPLAVLENRWRGSRKPGHEIVHVFAVRSARLEALPRDERIAVIDGDTSVGWYELAALRRGAMPFYPTGVLELAVSLDGESDGC